MRQVVALLEDDKLPADPAEEVPATDVSSSDGALATPQQNDVIANLPTAEDASDEPQEVKEFWKAHEGETKTFLRTRIYPVKENDNGSFTLYLDADGRRNELTTFSNKSLLLRKFKQLEASEHNPYSGENLLAVRKRSTVDGWLNSGDAVKLKIEGGIKLLKPSMYLVKHTSGSFTLAPQKKFDKNHEAV